MVWWRGLAPRERYLIAGAVGLTILVVLVQFVILPMSAARAGLRADLEKANRDLERIETAYFQLRAAGVSASAASQTSVDIDRFKAELTQSAREKGLSIARLQDNSGRVGLTIDRSDPRLVFFWLEDIETRLGATIARLSLEQAGGELVRVTVEFDGGGT